jgi:hypothetical protein
MDKAAVGEARWWPADLTLMSNVNVRAEVPTRVVSCGTWLRPDIGSQLRGGCHLGVDVKVILAPPCVFYI